MTTNAAFKPIDPKRDEFRRYLERAGVIEALTKVIIRIVKERPENPLEYLRTNLGDAKHENDVHTYLQKELEEARSEINRLRNILENVSAGERGDTTNVSTSLNGASVITSSESVEKDSDESNANNESTESEHNVPNGEDI